MSAIQSFEEKIIARLKLFLPSEFYIASFPANPKDFDQSRMRAAALVHYSGSRYADGNGLDRSSQMRELSYVIVLYLDDLNGGTAAYKHLDTLRKALQNALIEGATPLKMVSERLSDQDAGRWEWQIEVACSALSVAAEQNAPRPRVPLNRYQQEG